MRDIIVAILVASLSILALFRPRVGLYGYTWYGLMRPDVLAWAPNAHPYSLVLAVATLLGSVRYLGSASVLLHNGISRMLLLLQIPLFLSVLFAQDRSLTYEPYWMFIRVIVMTLLIPVLIESESQLRTLFFVMMVSLGVIGAKFGLGGVLAGGTRYQAGYGGFLSDNNNLGLALVMIVPFCWYARDLLQGRLARLSCVGLMFFIIAAIVMTFSRGAALSLAVVFLWLVWRTRRRVAAIVAMVVLSAPAVWMVQRDYTKRLETIKAPTEEASAAGRIEYARAAVAMWKDYPLFGVGFGGDNWVQLSPKYLGHYDFHVVHNTYAQMLVDSGIFAFLLYVALLWGTIWRSGRLAKKVGAGSALQPMLLALQASLVAFAVGSTFLSRVGFDLLYIVLMTVASAELLAQFGGESALDPMPLTFEHDAVTEVEPA
jgi:putative inorganic carbon (HCO3(-)) transporter